MPNKDRYKAIDGPMSPWQVAAAQVVSTMSLWDNAPGPDVAADLLWLWGCFRRYRPVDDPRVHALDELVTGTTAVRDALFAGPIGDLPDIEALDEVADRMDADGVVDDPAVHDFLHALDRAGTALVAAEVLDLSAPGSPLALAVAQATDWLDENTDVFFPAYWHCDMTIGALDPAADDRWISATSFLFRVCEDRDALAKGESP